MSNGIGILLVPPSYGGEFPKSLPYRNGDGFLPFPLDGFKKSMKDTFLAVGMDINDGFFDRQTKYYPHNLDMLVLAVEASPDLFQGVGSYDLGTNFGQSYSIVGSVIAEREKTGDFGFHYYNKVFVIEELWSNGLSGRMFKAMQEMRVPGVLKTSNPENDIRYSKHSDVRERIGPYYFHGFGFVDKNSGEERFLGARSKFYAAARHIVENKPVTVYPIRDKIPVDTNLQLF